MFYAHFVLSKKGPLARIWLAAHWDKKLTKAHVFETNIDSSVEAIMQPQVKLALRTSGHLLLGVVRIYSRKAKYLLADCNEAFVKIKMAFRPGVVDLPEENREAAVAAITLQENFHDFDTTLADLNDFDVQAQFSVNQSRPEEITMREDLSSITFVGDDGFGDIGFDDREIVDASSFEDSLYKQPEQPVEEKTLNENANEKPMEVDNEIPVPMDEDNLGPVDGGFMDADDDDDDDDDGGFGGGVDQEFFGDEDFMNSGGLFEDAPVVGDVSLPQAPEIEPASSKPQADENTSKIPEEAEPAQPQTTSMASMVGAAGEQTTLINNEEEAFALPPLEATIFPGTETKKRRKRKLIVDEQKGFPGETMKLQLSDTSDIITTLDLAPPTKKLMHWKETGGVEKLFSLPGRNIVSKVTSKLFSRNLVTKQIKEDEPEQDVLDLDNQQELPRDVDRSHDKTREISTILEEPSTLELSTRSRPSDRHSVLDRQSIQPPETPVIQPPQTPVIQPEEPSNAQDLLVNSFTAEVPVPQPNFEQYEDPPSIAPFSVPPPSVPPPSVPQVEAPAFKADEDLENELMPENEEQEEKRLTKRTHQMQHALDVAFRYNNRLSFADMSRNLYKKQAASRFYTLLVLKKFQAVEVSQDREFGDIWITKGPQFGHVS